MRANPGIALVLAIALLGPAAPSPRAQRASSVAPPAASPLTDLIVDWNRRVLSLAEEEDRFLTLKGVRTAAMMHAAIHDALNSIEPRFRTWGSSKGVDGAKGADPIAAAAQAAFEVVSDQFPDRRSELEEARDRWIGAIPDGSAKERGAAVGRATAAAVLAMRADDGWDGEAEYSWHPMAPGVYAEFSEHSGTPEGFVFGAGWAAARPFLLEAPDQFRSPPPPAIDSDAYTRAFREVKEVGRYRSEARTPDQTHLAMWWKEFVESSHSRLARDLVERERPGAWETARLFALLEMSVYDAYVCVFDNKFFYNHWRPYTAIRWAAHDGNPDTAPDPDWTNTHRHTYAFPSYPSAHGCASAAAMTILADTFGDGTAFTMRIPVVDRAGPLSEKIAMDPPTRSFERLLDAAWECSLSRVYLGIHFRYDSVEGTALGRRIGRYAVEGFLVPLATDVRTP